MHRDVTFLSQGLRCSGRLDVPASANGRRSPAIILANGLAAIKAMILPDFAVRFVRAGFVTLSFDYRHFGDSEGQPRHQLFPLDEVEDVRNAVTWLSEQPEVDAQRIGLWGTSYGGGIVTCTAAFDRRVRAVVAQVPAAISLEARWKANTAGWNAIGELLLQDRVARYRSGAVNYLKIVSPGGEPSVLPGREAYDEYTKLAAHPPGGEQDWFNGLTVESLEKLLEFDPVNPVFLVSPTPLLLMAAEHDSLLPVEAIRDTYKRAGEPKALTVLPIHHFEIYREPWLSRAADEEIGWFQKYL